MDCNAAMSFTCNSMPVSKYSSEILRLGSFASWPHNDYNCTFRPRAFVKAGLYYSGIGDKVACFNCGESFCNWAVDDDPATRHFEGSPGCDFIRNVLTTQTNTFLSPCHHFLDVNENYASSSPTAIPDKSWMCNDDCPKNLNAEQHRLHTFFDWPEDCPVKAEDLAAAGFFYLGTQDKVECAFCGGVYDHWEENDDPRRKHESQFTHCPFISGDATANIPVGHHLGVPLTLENQQADLQFGQQPNSHQSSVDAYPSWPAVKSPATTCTMASEETRFSSFFRWPTDSPIAPRKLAEAGFFYTGVDDQVKCFSCDGGLKDWQPGDDPWVEHAWWYGEDCAFVQREKGLAFIRECRRWFPKDRSNATRGEETQPKHLMVGTSAAMGSCEQRMLNGDDVVDRHDGEAAAGVTYDSEEEDMRCSLEALSKKLHHLREERLCKVCMYSDACMVFMPCGHICCCKGCADVLMRWRRKCPNCNDRIHRSQRASHH